MSTTLKKPTAKEQTAAKLSVATLKQITASSKTEDTLVFQVEGKSIAVPGKAIKLLERVLDEMAAGNTVEISSVSDEITTQKAAEILKVSRPHLVKLLEAGKIPFKKVGAHRRVMREDIRKYDENLREIRRKNLELLAKEAQDLGLGY